MHKRLMEYDPETQTQTWFHYHVDDDSFTIETVQETDDVVEDNKRDFNGAQTGWKGDMHKVASIPMNLWMQLKRDGIADDEKALKKWLNDPDNRHFRTKSGRV